ncbi:hypothetical protein MYCTH_2305349 [Thermothelomyces thermophilus ATCC 42464]|uniref:Carbohydrate-binding module family 50 protein n=1 Tax=Thermothelomyces thermophilus (strain ATCC 42464 / BCRC 31852 / DSM 1799) TaxID=573729 RepID=G2QCJ4_THET4|nr:uncharacterized protein MYCTH_2305349 [Thermothelomyces thermophilus ATCC 42464]AEO58170.1 hypothetical protein MYCTH_2305349 [Thermothelomyces thermophilus ATCC 42464]
MGRWSYLDSDEERLPEGMVRVGYDADTQVYTYRDSDGSYWEGAPGARYGKLHRVRSSTPPLPSVHIANDIRGEEQPYILHDFYGSDTDESSGEGDPAFSHGNNGKTGASPRSPTKAVLHGADRPHHPTPGKGSKTLPRLFTATNRNPDPDPDPDLDTDTDKLSTATTIRASVSSAPSVTSEATTTTATNDASTNARTGPGLRRAGTLSRLARFLSPSSPSPSDPGGRLGLARRATVHSGTGGEEKKKGSSPSRSSSFSSRRPWAAATSGRSGGDAAGNARWPGSGPGAGTGSGPGGQRKKCATTFEEILGE